ncbi:DUF488 domain-containing protein [Spongiibacter nanhainus]|uniref:DUF488 domain-containing protein n=1 Tax=Spongiibacter nanhainus TaxID=2794344 RepID=A0A7T4UR65_9GAMM|nr:DUF488 domain-containing protein [Spongiibacter nanhainus]QQD19401.1 DUF488 domain-containing protein [Spongiibacter nanhainus]
MLYSIGYATKAIEDFLAQLDRHNINAIADVRSVPYSKVFHDYHREALAAALRARGIHYVYLGDELGPRSKDPSHYDHSNQVQFDRLQQAPLFQQGIERLQRGIDKGLTIALLCAEKDPAVCHRSLLIGHYWQHALGMPLTHILHSGELETQTSTQQRWRQQQPIVPDMLTPEDRCDALAWQAQCRQYAYRRPMES